PPARVNLEVGRSSIRQAELISQDVLARDLLFYGIMVPAQAAHFASRNFAPGSDRAGEFLAQIKISGDAFVVRATETKQSFGVLEICFVLQVPVSRFAPAVEVLQVRGQ